MNDQAEKLRSLVQSHHTIQEPVVKKDKRAKVLTVLSGKGGVGKSVIAANLAVSLSQAGKKVLLIDIDIGFANADIILGVIPKYHLNDVIKGRKRLEEVIIQGPAGVEMIAGGSVIPTLGTLNLKEIDRISSQFGALEDKMDYIIIDSSAGFSPVILNFIKASDDIIVVTNPEPPAIADAYCITKSIIASHADAKLNLVVNRVETQKEGQMIAQRLQYSIKRFLDQDIEILGLIEDDHRIQQAVKKRTPFCLIYPSCEANKSLKAIVNKILQEKDDQYNTNSEKNLFQRILSFLAT